MRSPALWLYLLGAVTVLAAVLRRVLRRQIPLSDELYYKKVAVDHVQSGIAWVGADNLVRYVNPSLAKLVGLPPREILGKSWETFFPIEEQKRVEDIYHQALLMGKTSLETKVQRYHGGLASVSLLVVTVHDHKSRLVGHYCFVEDKTREMELEERIQRLSARIAEGAPSR